MRRTASLASAATILIGLAISGCGGDSEPLTREELAQRGDELCRAGQQSFAEIQSEPPANASAAVDQTDDLIDAAIGELDGLRDLKPPDELQDKYERYIAAREDALDLLEEGRDAADRQDARAYGDAQAEVAKGAGDRQKLAREIGFKDCSNPQTAPGPQKSG